MTLTASELEGMRSLASDYLAGTAIIQRKAWVSDGGGGGTTTWSNHGTVDARLAPANAIRDAEPMTGGRVTPDADWTVTVPYNTDVLTEDRILIADKTLEVAAVPDRTWKITKVVTANEVS